MRSMMRSGAIFSNPHHVRFGPAGGDLLTDDPVVILSNAVVGATEMQFSDDGTTYKVDIPAGTKSANGNVLEAHHGCVLGHLMNNSYRLGKKVPFNAKAGGFSDNSDASEHFLKLHDIMSKGVGLPEDGTEYTVGPWLTFNPETERHTGAFSTEANELLKNANRPGFQVPDARNV